MMKYRLRGQGIHSAISLIKLVSVDIYKVVTNVKLRHLVVITALYHLVLPPPWDPADTREEVRTVLS